MFLRVLTLFFLFCRVATGYSQESESFVADSVKKAMEALQITTSIHIDGILDEPEWKQAMPSPRFTQIEPYQNALPGEETIVRVLYNQQYLYVGVFSYDALGKKAIRATDFKRDFNPQQHDLVCLVFDGFKDYRNAMIFATNAYGVQRDLLAFDDLYYDSDWDGLWRVRTSRTDSGWAAEMAIPWQTLRYKKTMDSVQSWGLNVYRSRRVANEITAFSPFPRSFTAARMEYAGILKNLNPPPPKPNIRFQPYVLGSYDRYKNFDPSFKTRDRNFKLGGELKWAINPNTVLDFTANTDFAQADADRQVNNVTRFSVFFPERRQFFLENASLFGVGISQAPDASGGSMRIQPFFSRRIGLDDNGNPIPIDAGGRFVHRSSKSNYGAIVMRQRGVDGSGATNFFVGRYSQNFGRQNRVGGLLTVSNRPDGTNFVSAADGFFRLGNYHSINSMIIHSVSTKGGKHGFSGFAQYLFSNNQWKIWWTQSVVTQHFNADLGFVSRSDVIASTPGLIWYYRGDKLPFKKVIRAFEPGINAEYYYQASTGKLVERTLPIFPLWLNFQSGAYFGYGIIPTFQHLTEPFQPLGVNISTGDYNFTRQQIWASTDPSKKLNMQLLYTGGNYFNGKLNSGDWTLQFAPNPHFSITGLLSRNRFKKVGDLQTTTTIDLYSIEGRFALNPRLQLISFYQRNSQNSSWNYNIRFSWEYKPLSYIYLVYNRRGFNSIAGKELREEHGIAKISYLRQL